MDDLERTVFGFVVAFYLILAWALISILVTPVILVLGFTGNLGPVLDAIWAAIDGWPILTFLGVVVLTIFVGGFLWFASLMILANRD